MKDFPMHWLQNHFSLRFVLVAATLLLSLPPAIAETSRADLLQFISGTPINPARAREWQPLVNEFGGKAFSEWERGLYEGALGHHDLARQWLLKAAIKGNTPEKDALCLAYKLARGTFEVDSNDPLGEKKKSDAAEQQLMAWYQRAATKQAKKQKLLPEEKAAFIAIEALPDGDEGDKIAYKRLVTCRNLTDTPNPEKLFRAALAAGKTLPGYAINFLGIQAEGSGNLAEAARMYAKATEAGFAPARTNQIRLQERITNPAPGDKAWEPILIGYRQQAEHGDGSAMIYQADLMERGSSGPTNTDIAILLYKRGIDAGQTNNAFSDGMGYVFLAMYAQERLTEHYKAGRLKLDSKQEREKYLSMVFNLQMGLDDGNAADAPEK